MEGRRPRRRGGREGSARAAAVPGLVEERQVRERGSVRAPPPRDRSESQQPGESAEISASAPERCDVQRLREGVLRPRRGLQLRPRARGDARVSEGGGSVEVAKDVADPRTAGPGVRRVAVPGLGVERRVSERESVRAQPLPHEREHSGENRGVIGTALVCHVGSVRSVESVGGRRVEPRRSRGRDGRHGARVGSRRVVGGEEERLEKTRHLVLRLRWESNR